MSLSIIHGCIAFSSGGLLFKSKEKRLVARSIPFFNKKLTKRSKQKQTLLNLHNSDRFSGIFYKRNCKICQEADRYRVFSILTKFKDGGRPDDVVY